ncbi:MAG: hypothetical protein Fur0037_06180 [Planctomycetota bacterium]
MPFARRLPIACLSLGACEGIGPPPPAASDLPVPKAIVPAPLCDRSPSEPFSFLVAGHLYGDPEKAAMPAGTFKRAIPALAASGADLLVSCGDLFRIGIEQYFDETARALAGLPFPVFNAPGNHDVADRAAYERRYGPTLGAFVHGGCLFVLLDTERTVWEIEGDQLRFLERALSLAEERDDLRAVFCFAHKLVFCHRKRYFEVLVGGNAIDGLERKNRFVETILPLLARVAREKPVVWCAGDIGTAHTLPAFFDRDPGSGVLFLATGIGDLPRDCVLRIDVEGREVRPALVPLSGGAAPALEEFGPKAWARHVFPGGMPPEIAAIRDSLPD